MRHLPLVESRSAVYEDWPARPDDFDSIPLLRDERGRRYTYLRLSVTLPSCVWVFTPPYLCVGIYPSLPVCECLPLPACV